MREELRKKHEEETKAIEDEEQEDAVIDNIEDRYQLVLTALKIENDLQLEAGAIPSQVHDQRVEGYAQIEAQNSLLTRKRVELSEKRKAFAKDKSSLDADRVEGELARIREMEKRVEKLDAEVSSAVQSAEIDMQKTREALKQMHGGDSPRDSAKSRLDREAENVKS